MSNFGDVGDFHRKFGLKSSDRRPDPRLVDDETFMFRLQFLHEELIELMSAHRARDLPGVTDALVDLVYVALGTAHMYGVPFDEAFAEVHRANMWKERSTGDDDERSKRGSGLDVVKPAGWEPPDLVGILERYMP